MKQHETDKSVEKEPLERVSVKITLDSEVVDFFKNRADGEDLINRILRDDMEAFKAAK